MRTDRGLDRLVTFLDAVVAIAITVLVLPLVGVLNDATPQEDLPTVLAEEAAQFGTFALSFVVIARLWLAHHQLVEQVGSYDRIFLAVNLLWCCTIVVLPFATQVVAVFGAHRLAVATYIGSIAASSACLSALAVLVWRRPSLRRAGLDEEDVSPAASLVTTGTLVVAMLLGTLFPAANYYALFLLFLTEPVTGRLRRRSRATAR